MIPMRRPLTAAVATALVLLASPTACAPTPVNPGESSAPPGVVVPPGPAPDGGPAVERHVGFVIEVRSLSGRPYNRGVSLTFTIIQNDGKIAPMTNPDTGHDQPGPLELIRTTPWRHTVSLLPNAAGV